MREYKDRKNAQKKHYYKDRFYVPVATQKFDADSGNFAEEIEELGACGVEILDAYVELDQLVVFVNQEQNLATLNALKNFGYEVLCEISAIDFITQRGGFEVFYQLLSIQKTRRMRVKCFVKKDEMLKSVSSAYKSANWAEREMYDMFGVLIKDHPNLKRLLMPDDWHSHPLLKSYPLHGDEQARWYEVDRIFGREYREVVGEENRDSARVDEKDTFNFSRIYREVERGAKPSEERVVQEYQEEGGVRLVKRLKRQSAKILKKRP